MCLSDLFHDTCGDGMFCEPFQMRSSLSVAFAHGGPFGTIACFPLKSVDVPLLGVWSICCCRRPENSLVFLSLSVASAFLCSPPLPPAPSLFSSLSSSPRGGSALTCAGTELRNERPWTTVSLAAVQIPALTLTPSETLFRGPLSGPGSPSPTWRT